MRNYTSLSYGDIIPDDLQSELIFIRDSLKQCFFRIGDIANEIYDGHSHTVQRDVINAAVGALCGKSGRTVRYYSETALFFPPEVRQEFEVLSFTHFVYAHTFGASWRVYLEKAAGSLSRSAESIAAELSRPAVVHEIPENLPSESPPETPGTPILGESDDDEEFRLEGRRIKRADLAMKYVDLLASVSEIIMEFPLAQKDASRLSDALRSLHAALPAVLAAANS